MKAGIVFNNSDGCHFRHQFCKFVASFTLDMKYQMPKPVLLSVLLIFSISLTSFLPQQQIERMSMQVVSKSLKKGQSVTTEAMVYYTSEDGGHMTTKTLKPFLSYMMINSKGELKIYDPKANTILIKPNSGISSQSSFMYFILNGHAGDMGLKAAGFSIADTRFENGMVITTWQPPSVLVGTMGKVELVHEKYLPVYMAYFDSKNEPLLKVFYSNYTKVKDASFPLSVTEFRFTSPVDSTIEKKVYSNIKTNEAVDDTQLNFKIPSNARSLQQ